MERELGPFGRSFLGDFPTRGTLAMSLLSTLLSFILADGLFSSILLSIITTFLIVYFCYNAIEPHFNPDSSRGDFIVDLNMVSSSLDQRAKKVYNDSGIAEIWDFTGEQLTNLLGRSDSPSMDIESDRVGETWLKITSLWFAVYLSMYAVALIAIVIGGTADFSNRQYDLFFEAMGIVTYLVTGVILLVAIMLDGKLSYLSSLFKNPGIKRTTILVLIVSIVDFILVIIYTIVYDLLFGVPDSAEVFFADAGSASDPLVLFTIFVILAVCAPLFEELVFRGYILDSLRGIHSDRVAILASGAMFGIMHYSIFDYLNFYPIGATAIGGIMYAWLRIRTGSIWPPIICHSIWNGTIFFFEYIY